MPTSTDYHEVATYQATSRSIKQAISSLSHHTAVPPLQVFPSSSACSSSFQLLAPKGTNIIAIHIALPQHYSHPMPCSENPTHRRRRSHSRAASYSVMLYTVQIVRVFPPPAFLRPLNPLSLHSLHSFFHTHHMCIYPLPPVRVAIFNIVLQLAALHKPPPNDGSHANTQSPSILRNSSCPSHARTTDTSRS